MPTLFGKHDYVRVFANPVRRKTDGTFQNKSGDLSLRIGVVDYVCKPTSRITFSLIEKLNEEGCRVHLATSTPPDLSAVEKMLGKRIKIEKVFGLIRMPIASFVAAPASFSRSVDCIVKIHGPLIPFPGKPHIFYDFMGRVEEKHDVRDAVAPMMRLYRRLTSLRVVCRSNYAASELSRRTGINADKVIYPPVDTARFGEVASCTHRKNHVLSLSLFGPEKRHLDQVELLATLSKRVDLKMVMIGDTLPRQEEYPRAIMNYARRLGVEENLSIRIGLPLAELQKHLSEAKVFLHTKRNEYFGLAILEGMCSGLIPVVHDSGGPKEFLPRRFRYADLDEAARLIEDFLNDATYMDRRQETIDLAKRFDERIFQDQMMKLVVESICDK